MAQTMARKAMAATAESEMMHDCLAAGAISDLRRPITSPGVTNGVPADGPSASVAPEGSLPPGPAAAKSPARPVDES